MGAPTVKSALNECWLIFVFVVVPHVYHLKLAHHVISPFSISALLPWYEFSIRERSRNTTTVRRVDKMTAHIYLAIILLLAALLSGCGTTGHVSVMHDVAGDADTQGQNPVCTVEIEKPIGPRIAAKYEHVSWCSSGWPQNENPESTIDAVGIGVRIW